MEFPRKERRWPDTASIAARGNAIIAEILRLSDHVPEPFKLESNSERFKNIVIDFTYLEGREAGKGPDYYERVIDQSEYASSLQLQLFFFLPFVLLTSSGLVGFDAEFK